MRWDAVLALEGMPGDRATELLVQALQDPDYVSIRWRAAIALGRRQDPRAVEPLLRVLESSDHFSVREEAAEALGSIGDERAVPALIRALEDRDRGVRLRALQALVEIGAKEPLRQALKGSKAEGEVEEALRRIGGREKRRE